MNDPAKTTTTDAGYDEPYRYSREDEKASFEIEDRRHRSQGWGWLILAAMIAVSLAYHGVIYLLQPGLR